MLMRWTMRGVGFAGLLFAGLGAIGVPAMAQADVVTLTPAVVEAGSPVLIRVDAPATAAVDGEWMGRRIEFFHGRDWLALAGVDVSSALGPSTLKITVKANGVVQDLSRTVEIHEAHYKTESLTVAEGFVEPKEDALARIKAESALKARVFGASAHERLWDGDFRTPVVSTPTDSFGERRMFNGKLASIHQGMDFRARKGTPVRAGNSGVVVLARALYYEGNCVVIDHGLGLFTLSMHLSRLNVHEGQHVAKGQLLGLSGATGRVTGPHLHWAVRWQGAYLDPAKLLRMDLSGVR
jgi:murein DD-endopeptidase MepM/ murein hydrolase activator NlpD